jgi:hypothetical protein
MARSSIDFHQSRLIPSANPFRKKSIDPELAEHESLGIKIGLIEPIYLKARG